MRPREGHELREQLLGPGRRGAGRAPLRLHDHAPELAAVLGEEVGPGGPERRGVAVAEDVRRRVDELVRLTRAAHGRHGARGHAEARRRRAVVGPVRDGDLGAGSLAARLLQVQQQLDGREHGRRALDLQAHAPVVPEGLGQVLRELLVEAVVLRRQRGRRVLHERAREAVRRERVERRLLVLVALDEHAAQRLALEDLAAGAADGQHRRLGSLGRAPDLLDAPLAEDDGRHAQHRAVVRAARDARGRGEAAAREAGGHRVDRHFFWRRKARRRHLSGNESNERCTKPLLSPPLGTSSATWRSRLAASSSLCRRCRSAYASQPSPGTCCASLPRRSDRLCIAAIDR